MALYAQQELQEFPVKIKKTINLYDQKVINRTYPRKIHADLLDKLIYYQGADHHAQNHGQKSSQQRFPPILLPPIQITKHINLQKIYFPMLIYLN